jgi:hypothetical protein
MPKMETAYFYRDKAARCRRLAEGLLNPEEPVVPKLLALAEEFEAKAIALEAEAIDEAPIEQSAH